MTKNQKTIKGILTVACLIILALLWFVFMPGQEDEVTYDVPNGTAEFHFIDVGQGDATLIKVGTKNVLIDTGDRDADDVLLAYLNEKGVAMRVRHVLVPGYTDSEADLAALGRLLHGFSNLEKIEVLPYHTLGKAKYENLGIPYPLGNTAQLTAKDAANALAVIRQNM